MSLRLARILIQKKNGADGSLDGTITREELEEIYEMYEVNFFLKITVNLQNESYLDGDFTFVHKCSNLKINNDPPTT